MTDETTWSYDHLRTAFDLRGDILNIAIRERDEAREQVEGLRAALEDISLFAGSNYAAGVEWMRERAWREIKPAATRPVPPDGEVQG